MRQPESLGGKRTALVIVDGWGIAPQKEKQNNAFYRAKTPNIDWLFKHCPHTLLSASGSAIGLPPGQIGNSEVGHIAMGCGYVIEQDIARINSAIQDGSFFTNETLNASLEKAASEQRPVHLLGLVSDGGVHAHIDHLVALIDLCKRHGAKPLLHAMTDGRDTGPHEAQKFIEQIEPVLMAAGGSIATMMGRYYGMDRDHRWDRTELAWRAIVLAQGEQFATASDVIQAAYTKEIGDEFIPPAILPSASPLHADDQLILFNYRNDRPRQLLYAMTQESFDGFDRNNAIILNKVTTITEIDKRLGLSCMIAFTPLRPETTVSKLISEAGYWQFHCAETEKYPHITFYFNGGIEQALQGEDRKLIPSPKVATYDQQPEMSAPSVGEAFVAALKDPKYAFAIVNFANTDMVGHTAEVDPVIRAFETVDTQVGRIVQAAQENDWNLIITSDHGNCDEMFDEKTLQPNTQHTLNPVPFFVVSKQTYRLCAGCAISSIAPTILELMGLEIPATMTAPSLIEGN